MPSNMILRIVLSFCMDYGKAIVMFEKWWNIIKFYKIIIPTWKGKWRNSTPKKKKKTNIQPKVNTQTSKHNNGGHIKLPIIVKEGKRTTYEP
jgi:hypothetical protein